MRAGSDLRLLRAAVFAAACAALAAAGHVTTSGPRIDPWALAAGWAAVFAIAAPLAGRERRSTPALAAILAAGQLTLHCLYCLGQHATTTTGATTGATASAGHGEGLLTTAARLLCNDHTQSLTTAQAEHLITAAGLDPAAASASAAAAETASRAMRDTGGISGVGSALAEAVASLASAPMLLGHLLAAAAAGWLLRHGEAALWRLVRLSTPRTASLTTRCLPRLRRALRLALGLAAGLHGGASGGK